MEDRLIELIQESVRGCSRYWASVIAEHLIANGFSFGRDPGYGWIPTSLGLPEQHSSCIVYRKSTFGNHISMVRYSRALGFHYYDSEWGDITLDDVTHWMPLPEPPEEV